MLQVHGSTAMNPDRRQPCPLATMDREKSWPWPSPAMPLVWAGCRLGPWPCSRRCWQRGWMRPPRGLTVQLQPCWPRRQVLPTPRTRWRCRGRRKAPSPLTRGESQRQPCGCNGRCWRGRKRIDRPWMYFGRGHLSTWGLSSTQLGSSRRHWHQPRQRFGSCGSWRAASQKHGGFWP